MKEYKDKGKKALNQMPIGTENVKSNNNMVMNTIYIISFLVFQIKSTILMRHYILS